MAEPLARTAGFIPRDFATLKSDETRRKYANELLQWASAMETANPKLSGDAEKIRANIRGAFEKADEGEYCQRHHRRGVEGGVEALREDHLDARRARLQECVAVVPNRSEQGDCSPTANGV
jgi:hypothetical protein